MGPDPEGAQDGLAAPGSIGQVVTDRGCQTRGKKVVYLAFCVKMMTELLPHFPVLSNLGGEATEIHRVGIMDHSPRQNLGQDQIRKLSQNSLSDITS